MTNSIQVGADSVANRKLIIGIDFGTTFSGIAWAESRRPDHVSLIKMWPDTMKSHEGWSSPKVPTELRYTSKGTEWGFQIPKLEDRHQWFKLGLYDPNESNVCNDKNPEELITDFLTKIHEHLMYILKEKLGALILRLTPMEFCLTVPAMWPELAKEKTLQACQKAGFQSDAEILLVSEPEAAASYALQGLDPHFLHIGDTFVLCDAGGGTVDLISYTITDVYPQLKVREAAPGSGGLCGSTFLNRAFGEFLKKKLGSDPNWDNKMLLDAMDRFETLIKIQYTSERGPKEGWTIAVPGLEANTELGISGGRFYIKPTDIQEIFDPIVNDVKNLVTNQIKATKAQVKAVLLVGGFGQNGYLKECLRTCVGKSIEVRQPPQAWTAVVQGAVLMCLARSNPTMNRVEVTSRVARKHYGIELDVPFHKSEHDITKRHYDKKDGIFRVPAMSWFIQKGEAVQEGQAVPIEFLDRDQLVGRPIEALEFTILCDERSTKAPIHQNSNTRGLVTLTADLSQLSEAQVRDLETFIGKDGIERYKIPGSIEATFGSASTKYVLVMNGQHYDTVTAEYV